MSNNPFLNIRVPQSLIDQRLPTDKNLHDPKNPFNQTAKKLEARNTNKIRENALRAVETTPEEAMSLRNLGVRNNIPARMMLKHVDPTKVRSQEIIDSAHNFLQANPRMYDFLSNPTGIQLIQDDFDNLQQVSYFMRAIAEAEEDIGMVEETIGITEGLGQHAKGLAKSAEIFIERQSRTPGGIEAHLRREAGYDDYMLPMVQKMWGITDEMLEERDERSIINEEQLTNELREIRIQMEYLRSRGEQEGIGYYAREVTSGFLHMVPAVVASMATANPAVGASIMFGDVAMNRYGEATLRGADHETAMAEGALFGYVEYLTEKFAIDKIIRIGKGNKVADFFIAAGAEGVSEMFATAFEIGYDTGILDEEMTMDQAVTALVDSGVIGFGVGGSMRLTADALRKGTEMLSPEAAINNARARQEQLTAAQQAVQETKTAARDTETMREVLDAMGDGATVYIDAEDIIELHQTGVLVDTTIPYTLSQEAMTIEAMSGGAIEVKVSDLLTLTEDQFSAVSPLVRNKADSINAREAEEMLLERETVTQKLLEDFQRQMQQETGYQPIYDTVRQMLVDAGRSETEAGRMAQVWQANYEQLARDHQTKTAEELFLEHFVSVRRPGQRIVVDTPLAAAAEDIGVPTEVMESLGESAAWTDERLDSAIKQVAHVKGDQSQGMIAWVNPADFVAATHPDPSVIAEEAGELDLEALQAETQIPFLNVEDGKVVGHEGRHRLSALAAAGVQKVPVLIKNVTGYTSETTPGERFTVALEGQDFDEGTRGQDITISDAILAIPDNRDAIKQSMEGADVLFQPAMWRFFPDFDMVTTAVEERGGITLNPDGTEMLAETGYVATVMSTLVEDKSNLIGEMNRYIYNNRELLQYPDVVVGIFDFGDGSGKMSIDVNIVTQDRDLAIKIGTELEQFAIWDIEAGDIIETGGSGEKSLTLKEAKDYLDGNFKPTDEPTIEVGITDEQRQRFENDLQTGRTGLEGAVDQEGTATLVHFSFTDITRTDPTRWGRGLSGRTPAEKQRIGSSPGRTYFGIEANENPYTKEQGLGDIKTEHQVDAALLYDLKKDPDNLREKGDIVATEWNIRKAGYIGYWVNHPQLGKVAAVYEPLDAVSVTAPLAQESRGLFQQERDTYGNMQNIITLTEEADRSTFLHETGHFWLFQLSNMRNDPDLTEAGKAKMDSQWAGTLSWFEGNAKSAWSDFKKLEKDARKQAATNPDIKARADAMTAAMKHAEANGGADYMVQVAQGFMTGRVDHGTILETAFHEQWARGVEQYFMEGKAPTPKLRGAFRSFARWLRSIYASLKSLNVNLTPEVREVFDKFLVAGNAIDNERGKLIYRIPEEVRQNATEKELERLNQLVTEAENEAEAELQARVTKDLQRERKQEYRDKKAAIKKEVEADVAQRPLYKALRLLRKGEGLDNHPEGESVYLDRAEVESLTDADTAKKMPRGTFTKKEGAKVIPIEIAAGIAGFDSPAAMIDAMTTDYASEAAVVKAETQDRADNELADLVDPATISDTAAEIVQNDKQTELMTLQAKILGRISRQAARKAAEKRAAEEGAPAAAEDIAALEEARAAAVEPDTAEAAVEPQMDQILEEEQRQANILQRKAQTAAGQRIRQMSRAMDHAAIKEAAKRYVDTMPAGKMTPQRFRQTAERIAKRLHVAIAKRDYELAGDLMQQQAMNLAVAKQVNEAQKKMESQRKRIRNRMRKSDKDLGKLYNTDLLNGIRLLLEPLKIINPRARGMQPADVMEKLKAEDPNLAAEIEATRTALEENTRQYIEQAGKQDPWKVMPYSEYASLMKTVEMIMSRARDEMSMVVDGQRIEFEQIADDIQDATKDIKPAEKQAVGRGTERERWKIGAMTTFKNYVARVELWARGVDGQDDGPLARYLIQPVMKAANAYREARQDIAIQLRDMLLPVKDDLAKEVRIEAPELDGYVFNTKGEILHMLLHTGNESNFRKLLLGGAVDVATGKRYKWTASSRDSDFLDTSRVDAFINRMFQEGVLTKEHMDLVQGIWNLFEQTKGPAQQAHKRMHGHYFEEIPGREVVTPFGVYEGGYVPAVYDSLMNDEGAKRDALAQIEGAQTAAMFPGADEGFTKGRVDYNEPLDLNLMHIVLHLDKVQKFTYFGPVVRDAARMISNRRIRNMLNSVERDSVDEMLVPWLQRTARQTTSEPSNKYAGKFWSFLNRSAGLQVMAGNIINSIQQYTGFIAATTIIKPTYLSKAIFTFRQDELSRREYIITKSPYMASRMVSSVNDMVSDITSALTDKNLYDKAQTAANRYGYLLQQMVQNTIDPAVWMAAEAQFKDSANWQKVYDNNIEELGDFGARQKADAAAIAFADRVVRDTQTPLEPQDVARVEALGPFAKMFTKFAGYFINMHNLSKTEWKIASRNIGYESEIPGRRFQIFLIMYLNYVIAEGVAMAIRGSFEDIEEKEDEDLYWDAFNLAVMSPIKGVAGVVPGANSLISYGMGQFTPQFYDDRLSASPVLSIVEGGANAGVRFSGDVYALLTEGETDRDVHKSVKDLLNAIGIMTGLPTNWFNKPITYAIKVEEGVADPEGAIDIIQGALTGKDGTE